MDAGLSIARVLIRQLQGMLGGNRIVRGIVDVTAGTPTISEGTGFTITDVGVGNYTVNFTPVFADVPAVVFTGADGGGTETVPRITAASASAATVLFVKRSDGTVHDTDFHFVAVGP